MLWYLLYPLRGTTSPPRLSANHPVRRAFYRHGKTTAQHWLLTMLVAVAIAMGFSYPSVAFQQSASTGLSSIAHQVWTTAKPVEDDQTAVDVEMRQIWIHGSFMNALDKNVLKQALKIQQSVIGDGPLTSDNGHAQSTMLDWGYHSPLMYWDNSEQVIDADVNLLRTINERKQMLSSLDIQLRPATVLAGRKFDKDVVIAADALVITLMNHFGSDTGNELQRHLQNLKERSCKGCTIYPDNGQIANDRIYELSLKPVTVREHSALAIAYGCMALYVLVSLRRMRAFHSRFGLVVTAITQMTCSILASFTICGFLKINLSTIPHSAYPFVVLVFGVENMFRLINAVLAYPPAMSTDLRIANGMADIGPISAAAALQNLAILSILSTVVSPGVAAFCAFAAIATLFDAFFLLTFFVAVLNVDIHRLELQDALAARHSQPRIRHRRHPSSPSDTWFDALVHGRLPFSTRMAGTVVTTTFILSLNYHFSEHHEQGTNLRQLLGLERGQGSGANALDPFPAPAMNATSSPGEWMRMQELETAREVIKLAKPGADSLVVRIFTPLVVVLGGSDRSGASTAGEPLTYALRSFATTHLYPVAVAVVFTVAFVFVLMNYLLYNQAGDEDNDIALEQLEDQLMVQNVSLPHKLDVVKLVSSENGHFLTVGLDRTIAISVVDRTQQTHQTVSVPSDFTGNITWPIRHVAIDGTGEWIACHCGDDRISIYNTSSGSFTSRAIQYPDDHPALIFSFVSMPVAGDTKLYLVALTSAGRLAMCCMDEGTSSRADLANMSLVGAMIADSHPGGRSLYVVTEDGRIISFAWSGGFWIQSAARQLQIDNAEDKGRPISLQLHKFIDTELLIVTTSTLALLLNSSTLYGVGRLNINSSGDRLYRVIIGKSKICHKCCGPAVCKITVASATVGKDECVLTAWNAGDSTNACRCFDLTTPECRPVSSPLKERHPLSTPGTWAMTDSQAILGLRRRKSEGGPIPEDITTTGRGLTTSRPKQRRHGRSNHEEQLQDEAWEVYKLSSDGELETLDLNLASDGTFDGNTALYVNNPGPIVTIDSQAVAVAFGNTVKVIRVARRSIVSRRSGTEGLERSGPDTRANDSVRRAR